MITAILDTSVIVSYFCTQKSIHTDILLKKARDKIIILCTSRLLYQELQLAIQYGRVKKALQGNQNRISQFMVWYKYNAKYWEPKEKIEICRDPKDNKLLEIAHESKADYLVTLDKDLLVLSKFERTVICKPQHFNL